MRTYYAYHNATPAPGTFVIRFYHSGDEIRGYIRQIAEPGQEDAIFPGEEMEPETAFRMADNKNRGEEKRPIFVELTEGVEWNPAWGRLI